MADKDSGARSHAHGFPGDSVHDAHLKHENHSKTHLSHAAEFLQAQLAGSCPHKVGGRQPAKPKK